MREPDHAKSSFCAHCLHCHGDICSHPAIPVYHQPCGRVCIGARRCQLRRFR